ncbi:MAG: general secretion pathway protein GspK [Proteobacteria bacterium]|nr:general secretion pathway protein GspK [Pseudomonadota bacterium]
MRPSHQRGVALILVIWVIALMGVLLGSFALIARTENFESRHLFDGTTARYAAQAGIERAVYELRNPDISQRWVGDGRPYDFEFDGAQVQVELTDESGLIDINTADDALLQGLFISVGVSPDQAVALSDAIQDWRDPDDMPRPHGAELGEYKAAGLPYGPRNAPFQTTGEIQQVLGMNYELYEKIEPAITIYGGGVQPDPAYAPLEVLLSLPGMTADLARQLIAARQQQVPGQFAPGPSGAAALTLPDGTPVMAKGGGNTYTIRSRATLANGASTVLDASIRLGGVGAAGQPYTVLRWDQKESSR